MEFDLKCSPDPCPRTLLLHCCCALPVHVCRPKVPWRKFVNTDNQGLTSPEAFDLLDRLLKYDHHERITCAEALQHDFFAPIRNQQAAAVPAAATAPAAPLAMPMTRQQRALQAVNA